MNTKFIKQIGKHSFLFVNNSPDIYYLSFEVLDKTNIKAIMIKLLQTETYVYDCEIQFNLLGTELPSAQEAINNISYLILNNEFHYSEEGDNIILYFNTKKQGNMCFNIYNKKSDSSDYNTHKDYMNKMQNKIQELLNIIVVQNNKIEELKKREEAQNNLIQKIEEVNESISQKINEHQNKQNNPYGLNNGQNGNNYYNNQINNNQNWNSGGPNVFMKHKKAMTQQFPEYSNLNGKNIKFAENIIYNPLLTDKIDNLLVRPNNYHTKNRNEFPPNNIVNLDNIQNYKK